MTKQFIIDFLKALESQVNPPSKCHHVITFARHGSDQDGWEDRLAVQVNKAGTFHCFFLDDGDFVKHPNFLAMEISSMLERADPTEQLGVDVGRYV